MLQGRTSIVRSDYENHVLLGDKTRVGVSKPELGDVGTIDELSSRFSATFPNDRNNLEIRFLAKSSTLEGCVRIRKSENTRARSSRNLNSRYFLFSREKEKLCGGCRCFENSNTYTHTHTHLEINITVGCNSHGCVRSRVHRAQKSIRRTKS